MSNFLDGPVAGSALMLRRAPVFLRVVVSPRGPIDALDQLDDVPERGETIYVYELVSKPVDVHLNFGGRNRSTGFYAMGDYRYRLDVDGETVRDTEDWRAWCRAQPLPGQVEAGL